MVQIKEQSHEDKLEMYMKLTKQELAEMLIEANKNLSLVHKKNGSAFEAECAHIWEEYGTSAIPFCKKCGEWKNVGNPYSTYTYS